MTSCAILGASGHGKVIAELAELNGYDLIDFYDDAWPTKSSVECWEIKGNTDNLFALVESYDLVVVAIGNNPVRVEKSQRLSNAGAKLGVLAHPSSVVSPHATLGLGTVVMANAVINPFSQVGFACIVNTAATIDHDCHLADGVHVSPGVNIAGGVNIGSQSWVGIGSAVKQLVSIGSNVTVGAGSTVIKDVSDGQTVIGCPAKPIIK
ncbi:acetyltransferase [Vibrio breoganii]|uniref:acetyltransferase n=1 Tax=Vibrio breoganii TaxID=553239 RepID=UPI000C82D95E|nr:acetyltransferase [Vibrio breoganii]PMO59959.1 acetyltransferase [Vibrio breoganii]